MRHVQQKVDIEKRRTHNIEMIASQLHMPIDEVGRVYDLNLARLKSEAKILEYLEPLVIRSTRESLKLRRITAAQEFH